MLYLSRRTIAAVIRFRGGGNSVSVNFMNVSTRRNEVI